ncbi:MAG: cobalamin biosynthesis protein CbiX [Planctomycetota bacterium]|nr:MAG: cobalamin biosynthesis protein CbiX [Planctomycetota bacterium]
MKNVEQSSFPGDTCFILFAHGSFSQTWRRPFFDLLQKLRQELGERAVSLAYLENSSPTLEEAIREAKDMTHFQILPLFMSKGRHLQEHLPQLLHQIQSQNPHISIQLLPPLGEHPLFWEMIANLVRHYFQTKAR